MGISTFWVEIYETAAETDLMDVAPSRDFSFKTNILGGYADASFTVQAPRMNMTRWYRNYLGRHAVVYSYLGDRVYEGRIEKVSITISGVKINMLGYWAHAKEQLSGLVYPDSVPKSVSDMVKDAIGLADLWDSDTYYITYTTEDITPKDFTGEAKLHDQITEAIKHGSDHTPPRQLFFQIWDHRVCYMTVEPDFSVYVEPDYTIKTKLAQAGTINVAMTSENIFNKIQVLYDDADAGQDFSSFVHDYDSQARWGVREGTYNMGQGTAGLASTIADAAILSFANPTQSSSLSIPVFGATTYMQNHPLYYIKAGDIIEIDDADAQITELLGLANAFGSNTALAVVASTSFSSSSNTMTIRPGVGNKTFDFLMTQLGLSTGSVS